MAALPEKDCRYAVFDFDFMSGEKVFLPDGLHQLLGCARECCMPRLKRGSSVSWMGSTMRSKLPTLRKWILTCSKSVHAKSLCTLSSFCPRSVERWARFWHTDQGQL